ncbi:uncharacterized protein LOC118947720 isoform X6 [Oncorhynchus mykiss]|uniref:uncharacterized protein LOC118947679 isoform X6 n=1 Tax=Oncorhynchus mykiss TaxID=8022 RepID=UPI001877E0C4|nr:uncharacterized protein LOC118947679 isoform X6 [Oncorhynchus mykiss]XP_036828654.1 uncharacterized protein LOC118947720 isoform X6 [Oncorhynchus mykiss]
MPKTSGSFFQPVAYWLFRSEMPSNVEIKARVSNATRLAERASQLSQSEGTVIRQQDTFFNCSTGRLKLRNLMTVLADSLGVKGEVRKERRLFLVGQTRVHLDSVEGLGHYMELEVVLREDQRPEEGEAIARSLMKELGVGNDSLVTGAYVDLLLEGQG